MSALIPALIELFLRGRRGGGGGGGGGAAGGSGRTPRAPVDPMEKQANRDLLNMSNDDVSFGKHNDLDAEIESLDARMRSAQNAINGAGR